MKDQFFKTQYNLCFKYMNESKNFIYFIIWLFLFFALVGFFVPVPDFVSKYILEYLANLLEQTQGFSYLDWVSFIFLNNFLSSFFGIIFGSVLGAYSFFGAIINGYVVGFVSFLSVNEGGFGVLWKLLPHGIFELPAIFISLGLGLKLGTFVFQKNKSKSFREYLWNALRVFIFVVLPLLIIAAFIEGSLIFLAK